MDNPEATLSFTNVIRPCNTSGIAIGSASSISESLSVNLINRTIVVSIRDCPHKNFIKVHQKVYKKSAEDHYRLS